MNTKAQPGARFTLAWLALSLWGLAVAQATTPGTPAPSAPTLPTQTSPAPAQPAPTENPAIQPAAPPTRPVSPTSSYVALGLSYYAKGLYDQAYVAFRAASENDPKSAEALLGLGRSQAKLRLFGPSAESLKKLVALDPKNASGYIALAQTYVEQYISATDRPSVVANLDEALKVLNDAETVQPNTAAVWNQRGVVYKLRGDYPRAIEVTLKAAQLDNKNSVVLFNLGDLYNASGDLSKAVDSLQKAVIADPADPYNRAYYARLLAQSGNLSTALSEAAQAANLSPKTAYATGQYGVVAYLNKDVVTARTQLNAAIGLDPLRYPDFYYYLGRLDFDASQLGTARLNLAKAVALNSGNWEYLYHLGLAYERGVAQLPADRSKARDAYQRALKVNPNYKLAQDALNRVK